MHKLLKNQNNKGIILFIVLVTVLVAVLLATVLAGLITSQSRLTYHRVARTQAYYAAMSAITLALERLRLGTYQFYPVNSCPDPTGCSVSGPVFPDPISDIRIIFCPGGSTCYHSNAGCVVPPYCLSPECRFCINATVTYRR